MGRGQPRTARTLSRSVPRREGCRSHRRVAGSETGRMSRQQGRCGCTGCVARGRSGPTSRRPRPRWRYSPAWAVGTTPPGRGGGSGRSTWHPCMIQGCTGCSGPSPAERGGRGEAAGRAVPARLRCMHVRPRRLRRLLVVPARLLLRRMHAWRACMQACGAAPAARRLVEWRYGGGAWRYKGVRCGGGIYCAR